MPLDDAKITAVLDWLRKKRVDIKCPACGLPEAIELLDEFLAVDTVNPDSNIHLGKFVPLVSVICRNCAHIRLFSAIQMGIFSPTKPVEVSEDAKKLLVAAKAGAGQIAYLHHMGGVSIRVGNKEFINPPNDPNEEARWRVAINELRAAGLIEDTSTRGEVFRMTKPGYEVAGEIEAKEQAKSLGR